ncbi:hypothetical protein niasHS_006174 [Heterodera schachtii]|uniref:Uncharacterized protein n=1 Tax=Heterodera schachtii TaxID=97005 RepID=A0ABD2JST1_HETSC
MGLSLFLLLVGIIANCNGDPKMKSVEEKSVPPAAFWPYILHPKTPQHKSEEREDYYDAVRAEEEEENEKATLASSTAANKGKEKQQDEEEEEEARQLQQMMALLLANIDPVPMFTASSEKPKTIAQTMAPTKHKVPTKAATALTMFKVDAETYDDERTEAGKDDEETDDDDDDEEHETRKMVDTELKKHKLVVLPDGSDSADVREADAEADGVEQMPSKGTVDGQTHFLVDGETGGEGPKMMAPKVVQPVDGEAIAKRKGATQFPKPPEAQIVRMEQ